LAQIDEISGVAVNAKNKITDFISLIETWREKASQGANMAELVEGIAVETGYMEQLEQDGSAEAVSRLENIKEFFAVADDFDQGESNGGLDDFLAGIALISDIDTIEDDNAVTLMTLHSAKGLEFPIVFITGMEEGIFPHSRSLEEEESLEEERRLCYVGLTRAQERLFLTHTSRRNLYGQTLSYPPSRFVKEIPSELLEEERGVSLSGKNKTVGRMDHKAGKARREQSVSYGIGEKVEHAKWGSGVIIGLKESKDDVELTISFQSVGIKKVLAKIAPISKLS